jgi:hypothetical protein
MQTGNQFFFISKRAALTRSFKRVKRSDVPSEIGELWIENYFEVHFWTDIQHQ